MNDVYTAVHDAVVHALHELESRDYNTDNTIVYIHPDTWREAVKSPKAGWVKVGENAGVAGRDVLETSNVPDDVVMVVDVPNVGRSEDAVAYGVVEVNDK